MTWSPLPEIPGSLLPSWISEDTRTIDGIVLGGSSGVNVDGLIASSNFVAGTSGWAIYGDGSAEFNDITIRDDFFSTNWDGANPANLATADASATAGFYLDSSVGAAQFQTIYAEGGELGSLDVEGTLLLGASGKLQTASSGDHLVISADQIDFYEGATKQGEISFTGGATEVLLIESLNSQDITITASGNLNLAGGTGVLFDAGADTMGWDPSTSPGNLLLSTTSGETPRLQFASGAGDVWSLFVSSSDDFVIQDDGVNRFRIRDDDNNYLSEWFDTAGTLVGRLGYVSSDLRLIAEGGTGGVNYIGIDDNNNQFDVVLNGVQELLLGASSFLVPNVYNTTTASAADVQVHTDGTLRRSTSSARYKKDIREWRPRHSVLDLTPSTFYGGEFHKGERLRWEKKKRLGLIAEDVAEHFPYASVKDVEGRPDAVDWNAVTAGVIKILQEHEDRLEALGA